MTFLNHVYRTWCKPSVHEVRVYSHFMQNSLVTNETKIVMQLTKVYAVAERHAFHGIWCPFSAHIFSSLAKSWSVENVLFWMPGLFKTGRLWIAILTKVHQVDSICWHLVLNYLCDKPPFSALSNARKCASLYMMEGWQQEPCYRCLVAWYLRTTQSGE